MSKPELTQIGWILDSDAHEAINGDDGMSFDIEPLGEINEGDTVVLNGKWELPYRAVYVADHNPFWDSDYWTAED